MPARRRAIGAEVLDRGVDFRVWAPDHRDLSVLIGERDFPLDREQEGYFRGIIAEARAREVVLLVLLLDLSPRALQVSFALVSE